MADVKKMKVTDLKTALKEAGLPFAGNKAELVARYEEHLASKTAEAPAAEAQPTVEASVPETTDDAAATETVTIGKAKIEAPTAKLDARAKRFGIVAKPAAPTAVTPPKKSKPSQEELEKIKRRMERFGNVSNSNGAKIVKASLSKEQKKEEAARKAARANRFAKTGETVEERLKREKRAARFGTA